MVHGQKLGRKSKLYTGSPYTWPKGTYQRAPGTHLLIIYDDKCLMMLTEKFRCVPGDAHYITSFMWEKIDNA